MASVEFGQPLAPPDSGVMALTPLLALLDAGSFTPFPFISDDAEVGYDGVITGLGLVNGISVAVFAQDSSYRGGSIGVLHGRAICEIQTYALTHNLPIIGIWNGGGARLQEGVNALTAVGQIFHNNVISKGIIPQISLVLGTCAGAACYSPALTDFTIIAADKTKMFLTGPAVTADFIGETASLDELGGALIHAHNGVANYVAPDDAGAIDFARQLLGYLSQNNSPNSLATQHTSVANRDGAGVFRNHRKSSSPDAVTAPREVMEPCLSWDTSPLPDSPHQPYDVRSVLNRIFDADSLLELQSDYAPNLVTGFARLNGVPIAIVASQPMVLAGTLDAAAADKGSRFITTAAAFGLPIITFVDVPGFLPGIAQERAGIIRRGANLVQAYVSARVPKITVIMRKGYGGAYIALGSKTLGTEYVFAWPDAEIAIMGAAGAVDVLHHRELIETDPQTVTALRQNFIQNFQQTTPGLAEALKTNQIDAIITPTETRQTLISCLTNR